MASKTEIYSSLFFSFLVFLMFAGIASAAPGDNVALASQGGIATQSSFFATRWPASNCINGVVASNSNAQLCHSKRGSDTNEWWDVELPVSVPIDQIVIYNRTNCCTTRILGLYVLVSDTPFPAGSDMTSLAAARAQATFEYLITSDAPVTTIPVGDLTGRHVRIQKSGVGINAASAYNLLEIQVFEGNEVELSMSKTVSDPTPNIDDTITFTLTISNQGVADATNFTVSDTLPNGFHSISAISHSGTANASGQIDWSIGTLPSGSDIALSFQAIVSAP